MSYPHHPQQSGYRRDDSGQFNSSSSSPFLQNFQGVSPEILNLGISAGQDMINKQKDRLMPGVSLVWNSLKIYFAVRA